MEKIDLKKRHRGLYQTPTGVVAEVEVPAFRYLMLDGDGDPDGGEAFGRAAEVLFSVAYALKFMLKKGAPAYDYVVMPLEGLWWADDMSAFQRDARDDWRWSLMIMQPDEVTPALFEEAGETVIKKKGLALEALRLETFAEGRCAQILHMGPYGEEREDIAKLHAYIDALGGCRYGKHHEIYLNDARRTAPERLKTILRQPYRVGRESE